MIAIHTKGDQAHQHNSGTVATDSVWMMDHWMLVLWRVQDLQQLQRCVQQPIYATHTVTSGQAGDGRYRQVSHAGMQR